jgi:hypothetical protein
MAAYMRPEYSVSHTRAQILFRQGDVMKHMVSRTWDKHSRVEKVERITEALNPYGATEAGCFKGRSYLASKLLGKGTLHPVPKEDQWNQAEISFQGKPALHIFDSRFGSDIEVFDEPLAEFHDRFIEILSENGIITWDAYLSRHKAVKPLLVLLIGSGFILAVLSLVDRDIIGLLLSIGMIVFVTAYLFFDKVITRRL